MCPQQFKEIFWGIEPSFKPTCTVKFPATSCVACICAQLISLKYMEHGFWLVFYVNLAPISTKNGWHFRKYVNAVRSIPHLLSLHGQMLKRRQFLPGHTLLRWYIYSASPRHTQISSYWDPTYLVENFYYRFQFLQYEEWGKVIWKCLAVVLPLCMSE